MLEELPDEYYEAIKKQDKDGDQRVLTLTPLDKERRIYSDEVINAFHRLNPKDKRGGVGRAVETGKIQVPNPLRNRVVILTVGGRDVRLTLNPNDKRTHPADQLASQIERSGLFFPADQKTGYVQLYFKDREGKRRLLNELSWRDAFKELIENSSGPLNKARHIIASVDPTKEKRPLRIGEDPNNVIVVPDSVSPEKESDLVEESPPINLESDGIASREDLLMALAQAIAKNTADSVVSQHDESNPDWRSTIETLRSDPIVIRKLVVRALHHTKTVAFPQENTHVALMKVGCNNPCDGVNTFSSLLTNCLASNQCSPPPYICGRRTVSCFDPCKLKHYLCEKIRCFLHPPICAWATSCMRSIRARVKRFLSCYKDCRENSCALRPADHCPDGVINDDECVQIKTICSDSDSSSSSDSDSDSDFDHKQLDGATANHVHHLRKQQKCIKRQKRRLLRNFCRTCHHKLDACVCKRNRHCLSFCSRRPPMCDVYDDACDLPVMRVCDLVGANFDPNNWRKKAATNIPTSNYVPTVNHASNSTVTTNSTQPSAAPAQQQQDIVMSGASKQLNFDSEEDDDFNNNIDNGDVDDDDFEDTNGIFGDENGIVDDSDDSMDIGGKYTDAAKAKFKSAVGKIRGKKAAPKVHIEKILVTIARESGTGPGTDVSVFTHKDPKAVSSGSPMRRKFVLSDTEFTRLKKAQTLKDKHRAATATDAILGNAKTYEDASEVSKLAEKILTEVPKADLVGCRMCDPSLHPGSGESDEAWAERMLVIFKNSKDKDAVLDALTAVNDEYRSDLTPESRRSTIDRVISRQVLQEASARIHSAWLKNIAKNGFSKPPGLIKAELSGGFEMNDLEHARFLTSQNDSEIYNALSSALDRTGTLNDRDLVKAVINSNEENAGAVARHISNNYSATELADEDHVGWAMGRYWVAHLNRRRILAWNKFAQWYNKRSCARKLCVLPVPACPEKPKPCKPCEAAADPCGGLENKCKLSSANNNDEKQEKQTTTQNSDSEEEDQKKEEEPMVQDDDSEEEDPAMQDIELEKEEKEEKETSSLAASSTEPEQIRSHIDDWWSESEKDSDEDEDDDDDDDEEPKGCMFRSSGGKSKSKAGDLSDWDDSDSGNDDEKPRASNESQNTQQQTKEEEEESDEAGETDEEKEADIIRERIESAKTRASAFVDSSSLLPKIPPHKFKVDNFIRVMKETGADKAYNNFENPEIDTHIVVLHDDHPLQPMILDALRNAKGDVSAQRDILAPLTVFVPRNSDGTMKSMNNVLAPARDGKTKYKFQKGSEFINDQAAGPPTDLNTGKQPLTFKNAVRLVYPVSEYSH